jgi:hypothetical protein
MRYVLVDALTRAARPLAIADMVAAMARYEGALGAASNKSVSDLLRTKISRGRVVRVSRGVYRVGSVPRSTAWHIQRAVRDLEAKHFRAALSVAEQC